LNVLRTSNGGELWDSTPLPLLPEEAYSIAAAYPYFLDDKTGWIALKLQSGSNFSLGRLFATQDGGSTWEERSLPLGEPVRFIDASRGFVAGGPAGDELYRTQDGGITWEAQALPDLGEYEFDSIFTGLPEFKNDGEGWLPVTMAGEESHLAVLRSKDGGESWLLDTVLDLDTAVPPAGALPFSLTMAGEWRTAIPSPGPYNIASLAREILTPDGSGFSGNIVALDFSPDGSGWALVQEGTCSGDKTSVENITPTDGIPLTCRQQTRLIATGDGGLTWSEVRLPD
jgi:photosystem II stability/assembly factor-like uncharacterized protein